jgi:hypothetical protein
MVIITTWTFKPEHREAAGGRQMLGRRHGIGTSKGVCVAESDAPAAIARWAQQWSDLMSFDLYPAQTDEDTARMLS